MKKVFYLILFPMIAWSQMTYSAAPMDSIAHRRALLDSVKCWSAKSAANYYQHHSDDQSLLRSYLVSRFMSHLDRMDYLQLRSLRRTFLYTDLQNCVNPIYLKRRAELLPQIKSDVEVHCKTELDSVESCRMLCKILLTGYIGNSIEGAMKGLMGGFLPDGKEDIEKLYFGHCAANIVVNVLKDSINNHVKVLVRQINVSRKGYINHLAGYSAATGGYQVGRFGYVVKRYPVDCPIDDLVSFQQMQGLINWFGLGLNSTSLIYNGVGVDLLSGQSLLSSQQINKNGDMRKLGPVVNNIAKATAHNMEMSIYQTVDEVFNNISKKIKESQIGFQNMVFAKY